MLKDKLETVERRFEEIAISLTAPSVISDNEKYSSLIKEHASLEPIVEKYREYKSIQADKESALELLSENGLDKEMRQLAAEELETDKYDYTLTMTINGKPYTPEFDDSYVSFMNT